MTHMWPKSVFIFIHHLPNILSVPTRIEEKAYDTAHDGRIAEKSWDVQGLQSRKAMNMALATAERSKPT